MEYNAADTRAIRRAQKLARQEEANRDIVVSGLVSTINGRAYVHDLLTRCHIFSTSFNPVSALMAYNEGERNVGLQILLDVMRCAPDQYIQMMREANDRHISSRRSGDNQNANGRDKQPSGATGDDGTTPGPLSEYDPYADATELGTEDGSEPGTTQAS